MWQSIQEWIKQNLWKTAFKNLKGYGLLKGCLPQILLGPFLNTLCHIARNNNKVDSVETGRIVFAHLLP